MTAPWLSVIGMGEDGIDGLSPTARTLVSQAEVLAGSERLLALVPKALVPETQAPRLAWPKQLGNVMPQIAAERGRRVVVLSTGDPLNYGVGRLILEHFARDEVRFVPHVSAFSHAAARLGWSLPEVDTVSLLRRPALIEPLIAPGVNILALTAGDGTVREVARRLVARGYGQSILTVLEHMGGPAERRISAVALDLPEQPFADLATLAVECRAGPDAVLLPRTGLPDDAFRHDGQITKREVRAVTLAALAPYPQAVLWDIGAGSGSVSIEWMRAARGARAVAFERHAGRAATMAENAADLGTPSLDIVAGDFLESHADRPLPDAVFIGGGITAPGLFDAAWTALKPGGRLVANAVTLDGEARLGGLHAERGGELVRIEIAHSESVGVHRVMRPRLPVTQWRATKP